MANGIVFTDNGRKIFMHRAFESSPSYTYPGSFKVGTGTTTPTNADTDLDTAITIGGNPTKTLATGYPVFDDTNLQVTNRGILSVTEANGNAITEFGIFNQDSTPEIFSRMVYNVINKTSTVQVIFVEKDKIQ